ncbi:ferrisiderophore receptor [Novosphingobium endophyticum]|uniref:Ferrisiderophore receptor n=1 Tax=Novosphingobium endophyticum TaxID=1955250 RepID=A0A916TSG1_9SPHN|nr:TonB-dependent siderophore receptor [Novosphingobium endophyticum]GGC02348.1 ferrisiderophore receptor [Novosphingobium endophyticum]
MKSFRTLAVCCTALVSVPAFAADDAEAGASIIVTGDRAGSSLALKTDTPAIETPQPVTVIPEDLYTAQGAVSISDTLRYVAGVQANPYGPDGRVDGGFVRGINALQFRDGMRDIFSYYASIRADPYNFSSVQVIRGPASVLFGHGSLGGLINLESKKPEFETDGEVSLRYGSHDRKEALADLTGPLSSTVAARVVARVRDSGTQTDHVPDDRVLFSPSLTWQPTEETDVTLIGLYQEDDGGSTSQFLPLVGTILPNPNGRLKNSLFIGKPGWDRYDGRLLQGTALVSQSFGENVRLNLKARYIDSDLSYFTHYPDSYGNPANPYVQPGVIDPDTDQLARDPLQRTIGLYSDASKARMEIFSTDNNLQFDFNTGDAIRHTLLVGVDYLWNRVRKIGAYGYEYIDIYDIDYDSLSDYGGGFPDGAVPYEDTEQEQLGFYLQDQIRLIDRVSVVLGVRHDLVNSKSFGVEAFDDSATSFRAGIIGEVVRGVSPFFSYTESFEPIAGTASDGNPFRPKQGHQFEGGIKFHPTDATLVTVTAYHIKENNRPVDDPSTADPLDQMQAGSLTSKGIELEGNAVLPGKLQLLANFSYNEAEVEGTEVQLDNVPKYNASLWATRPFELGEDLSLLLGGGVRYTGAHRSYGPAFPDGVRTPGYTLVDALAELSWQNWSFRINATNLLGKRFYSACLARGDCFMGEERNVFGTVSYHF